MTRTLILIRHAKSDWDDPRLTDHQRALNPRGRRAAPRIGAHNPGTAALARMLAKTPPAHPDFGRYPTAATTVLGFDAEDWRDIAPGTGQVRAFVTPRDLPDPA